MKIVKYSQLSAYGISYSRTHLARLEATGRFPKRCRIGGGIGWVASEIETYIANAVAARGAV
jgi:predicted DNA-binding transcriptional regulator AlpA